MPCMYVNSDWGPDRPPQLLCLVCMYVKHVVRLKVKAQLSHDIYTHTRTYMHCTCRVMRVAKEALMSASCAQTRLSICWSALAELTRNICTISRMDEIKGSRCRTHTLRLNESLCFPPDTGWRERRGGDGVMMVVVAMVMMEVVLMMVEVVVMMVEVVVMMVEVVMMMVMMVEVVMMMVMVVMMMVEVVVMMVEVVVMMVEVVMMMVMMVEVVVMMEVVVTMVEVVMMMVMMVEVVDDGGSGDDGGGSGDDGGGSDDDGGGSGDDGGSSDDGGGSDDDGDDGGGSG